MSKICSINIDKDASAAGLHEKLAKLAHQRATNISRIASKILVHAVNNQAAYRPPLKEPGENPGRHISAKVSEEVRARLNDWTTAQGSTRNKWCCFILQKAFENGKVEMIVDGD